MKRIYFKESFKANRYLHTYFTTINSLEAIPMITLTPQQQ